MRLPLPAAYGPLFATPAARRLVAASAGSRLAIGVYALPLILVAQQATGSFATAGVVVAAFSAGVALFAPLRGRLVDRRSPQRALPPLGVVSAAALLAIAVGSDGSLPAAALALLAALAGATTPPLVASMRIEWQRILGAGDPRLRQAYAFESSVQTSVFVVGPLIAGVGIGTVGARATLAADAVLLLAGTVVFAVLATAARVGAPAFTDAGEPRRSPIRLPGVQTLVVVTALADVGLGAIDVAVAAFASERGHPEVAGVLLALFAASAVVGALTYGAQSWSAPVGRQLVVILLAGAAVLALLAAPSSLLLLGVFLLLAGGPSAAQWSAASLALDAATGGRGGAEAFTWLSSANSIGIAIGSAVGGALVDHSGTSAAFLAGAAAVALGAVVMAVRRRTVG